ncbi:Y-family DNA polymerase [Ideonella sp. BN130291]|uniref:Y-family DNA polymerase n=1 Tax=Ideonella sp. BN130291 TaxID=3112940 RepID=UPI002E274299|nr:DNA polymerase Y family protein [Ideonella sp. BN130291]
MLWIAVHLPLLSLESFASTLGAEQQGQPLALLADHRIATLDAKAAGAGIKPGHKRATALALAPTLVLGEADPLRDALELQAAGHAALAFTPSVALQEDGHGVLLEVQASLRYFGGLQRLLQRLKAALQPLGHALQVATAPTALGALLLARWQAGFEFGRHTTDLKALAQRLDGVPVWLLGPGREHWEALQGMGLHTLGDLRSLPRSGVARRFSPGLLQDLDRAYGLQPQPSAWISLPPVFDSRLELFARADTTEQVLYGAAVLLRRLVAWAQAQHARVGRFLLRMHHEPRHREGRSVAEQSTLEVALAEPSADAEHLQLLLRERLANAVLAAPTLELSLHCSQVVKGAPPNNELFPTPRSEREGFTRLIERLQARLGREQVQQLRLKSDHRPECSGVLAPMQPTPTESGCLGRSIAAADLRAHISRPVWLLPEPEPLPERQFKPLLDGQPLQLLSGPERIETGWWDGALAQRDYFIAAGPDGALVWIYRDRLPTALDDDDAGSGWYLQGRFG